MAKFIDSATGGRPAVANTIAECILMLRRVRAARLEVMNMERWMLMFNELERLDRYERRTLSRLWQAIRAISVR
jgi:hypothetical protein